MTPLEAMSIQRYLYARPGMVPDAEHLRGSGKPEFWVRFTDHEAAIEQVLADAKARIEGLDQTDDGWVKQCVVLAALTQNELYQAMTQFERDCLAALTQPETEKDCQRTLSSDRCNRSLSPGGSGEVGGAATEK